MRSYGLIGKTLSHSFSKLYFEKKFLTAGITDCRYQNFELSEIAELPELLEREQLLGFNVTIPYKEKIIPLLDSTEGYAAEINAVNCVKVTNKKLIGYNTDVYGFAQSIKPFLDFRHQNALILGTGGASKAIAHALKQIGVEVYFASSNTNNLNGNVLAYQSINEHVLRACRLIVNCTPLGTFPDVDSMPQIPVKELGPDHFVYDLVYNPSETKLLKLAKEQGCMVINGQSMLELQAEKSWEIWNG